YLSHLAKALLLAEAEGHRTVGLLYGGSAAGAFIATALATGTLVALPGAHPAVMDLPSMARVTKLPVEVLKAKAEATPVFAPELAGEPIPEGWARAGRPLVVRRPTCSDTAGLVPLGLPLPPSHGKRRIAVSLAAADIVVSAPPPLLADAAAAAPAAWRATIEE